MVNRPSIEVPPGIVPALEGVNVIHKSGVATAALAASAFWDIWDAATAAVIYPFPTAAAETSIVSSDVDDDGDPVDAGARTVLVEGLDADFLRITETVTMNGQTPVVLANEFLRVYRATVQAVGATGVNEGNIDVLHGATVLARIAIGFGQTQMAIYTVPAGLALLMENYNAEVSSDGSIDVRCFKRDASDPTAPGSWQLINRSVSRWEAGQDSWPPDLPYVIREKMDIRLSADIGVDGILTGAFAGRLVPFEFPSAT